MPVVEERGHLEGPTKEPVRVGQLNLGRLIGNSAPPPEYQPRARRFESTGIRPLSGSAPSRDQQTQLALLEYRVTSLENRLAERDARERWMAGTLIALAAIVVSIVVPFLVTHP